MTMSGALKKYPGLLPFLAALVFFLAVHGYLVQADHRSALSETYHEHMEHEVELMAKVVRESALKHDLATVEEFLIRWATSNDEVLALRAVAANGFVLVDYRYHGADDANVGFVVHQETVKYRGEPLLTIEVVHGEALVTQSARTLSWKLTLFSTLLAAVMGVGLWLILRHTAVVPMEREIAQRKEAEAKITHLLNENELILASTGDGIYGIDREGRTTFANPATTRMIGWQPDEMIGQPQHDMLHHTRPDGSHYPREECPIYAVLRDGETRRVDDEVFWRKDGSSFPVEYVSTPIIEDGVITGAVVAFRNITERVRQEEELRQSHEEVARRVRELDIANAQLEEQAASMIKLARETANLNDRLSEEVAVKNRLFSIISHDLKSPFNALLGMTDMMAQAADTMSREKLVEYATDVNEAGVRVFELLHNLLDWSRLQMGGVTFEPDDLELHALAQASVDLLMPTASEKGIVLSNKVTDATAHADVEMVNTIVRNLITNAIKFTPADGSVDVTSRSDGDMVQVTVSDTGIGISAETAASLFAIDRKTTTPGTAGEIGTGLGLPLCRELVEMNGGKIWVDTAPGDGSRFHFTLPVSAADTATDRSALSNSG